MPRPRNPVSDLFDPRDKVLAETARAPRPLFSRFALEDQGAPTPGLQLTAGRGPGVPAEAWRNIERAQRTMARDSDVAASRLLSLADEIESGALTDDGQQTLDIVRRRMMSPGAAPTPAMLRRMAGHYGQAGVVWRSDGSDGYVIVGESLPQLQARASREHWTLTPSESTLMVTPLNGRTMYLNRDAPAINEPDKVRHGIGHEPHHPFPESLRDQVYNGQRAYSEGSPAQRQAFQDLPLHDPERAADNPDHVLGLMQDLARARRARRRPAV